MNPDLLQSELETRNQKIQEQSLFCFVLLEGSVQQLCPKSLSLKTINAPQGRWHLFLRITLGQDASNLWSSGSQLVVILPHSGHLAISGNIFGCHY